MEWEYIDKITSRPKMIEKPEGGCELNLSANRKWVRFIVDGKQIASFHVNYVNKVLAAPENVGEKAKPFLGGE